MAKLKKRPARKKLAIDSWKPERRQIYLYYNGERTIAIDPFTIWQKIMEYPELDTELKISQLKSAMAAKAKMESFFNVVQIVRTVFSIEPYSRDENGKDHGLLDTECMEVLDKFCEWNEALKKNTPPLPNSAPSGEPLASSSVTPNELGFSEIKVPLSHFTPRPSPPA